jgi:hypothetical protein
MTFVADSAVPPPWLLGGEARGEASTSFCRSSMAARICGTEAFAGILCTMIFSSCK